MVRSNFQTGVNLERIVPSAFTNCPTICILPHAGHLPVSFQLRNADDHPNIVVLPIDFRHIEVRDGVTPTKNVALPVI